MAAHGVVTAVRRHELAAIGKQELVSWVNRALRVDYTRIEDTSDGVAFAQLLDAVWGPEGEVPLHRLNFDPKTLHDREKNLAIVRRALHRLDADATMDVDGIAAGKFRACDDFLRWTFAVVNRNAPWVALGEYDAYARRVEAQDRKRAGSLRASGFLSDRGREHVARARALSARDIANRHGAERRAAAAAAAAAGSPDARPPSRANRRTVGPPPFASPARASADAGVMSAFRRARAYRPSAARSSSARASAPNPPRASFSSDPSPSEREAKFWADSRRDAPGRGDRGDDRGASSSSSPSEETTEPEQERPASVFDPPKTKTFPSSFAPPSRGVRPSTAIAASGSRSARAAEASDPPRDPPRPHSASVAVRPRRRGLYRWAEAARAKRAAKEAAAAEEKRVASKVSPPAPRGGSRFAYAGSSTERGPVRGGPPIDATEGLNRVGGGRGSGAAEDPDPDPAAARRRRRERVMAETKSELASIKAREEARRREREERRLLLGGEEGAREEGAGAGPPGSSRGAYPPDPDALEARVEEGRGRGGDAEAARTRRGATARQTPNQTRRRRADLESLVEYLKWELAGELKAFDALQEEVRGLVEERDQATRALGLAEARRAMLSDAEGEGRR